MTAANSALMAVSMTTTQILLLDWPLAIIHVIEVAIIETIYEMGPVSY